MPAPASFEQTLASAPLVWFLTFLSCMYFLIYAYYFLFISSDVFIRRRQ